MRDRLSQLIFNKLSETCRECSSFECTEALADYLVENGVIVPPCKVGQTVYLIPTYGGKPYCGIVQDKVQMIGITSRGTHIKARQHHDHNKMYMLGKSVFLTREEAEEALASIDQTPKDDLALTFHIHKGMNEEKGGAE